MKVALEIERTEVFDIEGIVAKPAWKQILVELIIAGRVDPWNVDIIKVSDAYIKKIKEMKNVELLVPANVILAASILLRYKSDYIKAQEDTVEVYGDGESMPFIGDIPDLTLVSRIPPKRQITVDELLQEMEKIIKYENNFKIIKHRGEIVDTINIKINEHDLEKRMFEVYEEIRENKDGEGLICFSRLIENKEKHEIIYTLLSVLHLTQKEYIDIRQDDIFGEIFIMLLEKK